MCEYCDTDYDNVSIIDTPEFSVMVCKYLGATQLLLFDQADPDVIDCEVINYCPMCGRKLKE